KTAEYWAGCALLELVKCSPVGDRSAPTEEMWNVCLGEFLVGELAVLQPRVLLVLGLSKSSERVSLLREVGGWDRFDRRKGLHTGTIKVDGHATSVVCVYHPGFYGWRGSLDPLAEYAIAAAQGRTSR
ncbi:MAG: hypothetical protein FJW90_12965, partial [Actinobacteria bacterium]|nr:hypothetical protein [Actinomycetota bacterium]